MSTNHVGGPKQCVVSLWVAFTAIQNGFILRSTGAGPRTSHLDVAHLRPIHSMSAAAALDGLATSALDGQNPAKPKKAWNADCPGHTNKQWFPMVSKWCRILSINSMGVFL